MRKVRNDIFSMMKKHGASSFFLTLSSADSLWPEGFIATKHRPISLEEARALSFSERTDIVAHNSVIMTKLWKMRVKYFLNFIMEIESKPLGEITHYVSKAEWQSRLSEHVHFLFWTKDGIPSLKLEENGELKGYQETIIDKAEAYASSLIHIYPLTTDSFGKQIRDEYTDKCYELNQNNALYERQGLRPLSTEDAIRSVIQEPTAFKEYFINNIARKSMNNLVRSVNIHSCSAYCT